MKDKSFKYKSHCPINYAQETFGDRWSLLIIRDLMFKDKRSYGDFLNSEEKISTNILANRLEKLEMQKLITKIPDPDNRSKNIYTLTQKGIELMPMLLEMIAWSAKYDDKTEAPQKFINSFKRNREALITDLIANLNK